MRLKNIRAMGVASLAAGALVMVLGSLFVPVAVVADGNNPDPPYPPIPPGDSIPDSVSIVIPDDDGSLRSSVLGLFNDLI